MSGDAVDRKSRVRLLQVNDAVASERFCNLVDEAEIAILGRVSGVQMA